MHILLLNLDTQKKQGLLESLDLPDSQLPAPSLRSTRGHPAKREVEPTDTNKTGAIASSDLPDSSPSMRSTRGRAAVKLGSNGSKKGQASSVPESQEPIRVRAFKRAAAESNKTGKPSAMPSLDLPDSQQAAPSVRFTRGRAAKRITVLTNTQKKKGNLASVDLSESQLATPSVRSTRGRPAKRDTNTNKTGKPGAIAFPDFPDSSPFTSSIRRRAAVKFGSNGSKKDQKSGVSEKSPRGCGSSVDEPCIVSDNDSDVVINWWIEALGLYQSDKEVLSSQRELTDSIINAAQILLSTQFPSIGGFQNTLLDEKLQFKPVSREISSIQIHHTGETHHWICSCFRKGGMIVQVVDSLGLFMPLNLSTVLQIAKIYSVPTDQSVLEIQKLSVQQQHGTIDCGLFSIAFAVEICLGRNPQYASFDQKKMREHLFTCFRNGAITAFPKKLTSELLPRPSPVHHKVKIYCNCRMPEEYDEFMISCDLCQQWFHTSCVNIKADNLPEQWQCYTCRN